MTTRTVSANQLSQEDEMVLELSRKVSNALMALMGDPQAKSDFKDLYGKVSLTRDAGAGRGAGKLQRDALCTRGRTDKSPLSNRNLRWHPLVVSAALPDFASPVEGIRIQKIGGDSTLVFVVKDDYGVTKEYPASKVHQLPKAYAATQEHWESVKEDLRNWSASDWSANRCLISAMEYCSWEDAFESYASLALATAVEVYDLDFDHARSSVMKVMADFNSESPLNKNKFPSSNFPKTRVDATVCPLCKKPFSENLSDFRYGDRLMNWQPPWKSSKRGEGEDHSIQVMHVKPLNELVSNHNAANVRFGHRWCNVSMTDHTLDETIDFFSFVASQHKNNDLNMKDKK
jgi:hypothetical protein